jgi:dihydropyrimidinase
VGLLAAYRTQRDQDALWDGVADNSLQVISTDHCPFWFEGGKDGRTAGKELGRDSFAAIPNGCPGIEDRMMVLYTQGVRSGKISINRWVELCCTNPAKLFGVYPQKGTVTPGADADIVIWDPNQSYTISAAKQHQRTDYNLYEGMEVTGVPSVVLSRGRVSAGMANGKDQQGAGKSSGASVSAHRGASADRGTRLVNGHRQKQRCGGIRRAVSTCQAQDG